jgi:DNA-binding NarL/FixJ family response regulator
MASEITQLIFDGKTGIETVVALTTKELSELETKNQQEFLEEQTKQAARQSALAKLAALGLTEEEIAAL